MKKIVSSILSLILITSLFGGVIALAAPKAAAKKPVVKGALYKDGTYDVMQKSIKPGYEEAIITIKGGKISNVVLKRLDGNKKELDYTAWNGKGRFPNLQQFRLDLAKAMLTKQSAVVDTISGATDSSNGWIIAAKAALAKAKK
jgi:uncharacterized protein with FMN-binding domain